MINLALRSVMVLGLLWGIVFAIGAAALYAGGIEGGAAVGIGIGIALGVGLLQYLLSPLIIQWIHKINWVPAESVDPGIARTIREICLQRNMKEPRFGIIEDGNPNAFTFGYHPGSARLVVTRGLVDICDDRERRAVVLHEMGHIVHWDFVVMTVAATVPLILYMIYVFIRPRRDNAGGGYVAAIAVVSYIFYWISQYIVLFLSRVREYYADRYAAEQSGDPNALAGALVKIGYGLAAAPDAVPVEAEEKEHQGRREDHRQRAAEIGMKAMGIFDPKLGAAMALAAAGSTRKAAETPTAEATGRAMRWDLWNPWAFVAEIGSSHPLPGKRIGALAKLSQRVGQTPLYGSPGKAPESYWDEFWTDVFVNYLPLVGLLIGIASAFGLGIVGAVDAGEFSGLLAPIGCIVGVTALGAFLRVLFMYPKRRFAERKVEELVGQVKVSHIRSIPAKLRGTIIGRGIPGLYWSEDLVLQDDSGFIVMDYRQPLRLLEGLFGLFRAEEFVGRPVTATGWYRRFPRPYLELWQVRLPDGTVNTCHNWAVAYYTSLIFTVLGFAAFIFGLILQMGA